MGGTCWLHRSCGWTTDHDCGHRKQNCVYGAPFPDLDSCDDGEEHLPCEGDFFYGFTCQKGPENEIVHIEHMNSASDCQAVCQNHVECEFFSHSSRHNDCWLHYNCDKLVRQYYQAGEKMERNVVILFRRITSAGSGRTPVWPDPSTPTLTTVALRPDHIEASILTINYK